MSRDEIVCALSGLTPLAEEVEWAEGEEVPYGWTRVTVFAQEVNPEYVRIQETKAGLVESMFAMQVMEAQRQGHQLTAEQQAELRETTEIQVDAKLTYVGVWRVQIRNPGGAESNTYYFVVGLGILYIDPPLMAVRPDPQAVPVGLEEEDVIVDQRTVRRLGGERLPLGVNVGRARRHRRGLRWAPSTRRPRDGQCGDQASAISRHRHSVFRYSIRSFSSAARTI